MNVESQYTSKQIYLITKPWFDYLNWIIIFASLTVVANKTHNIVVGIAATISFFLIMCYSLFNFLDLTITKINKKWKGIYQISASAMVFMFGGMLWKAISDTLIEIIR